MFDDHARYGAAVTSKADALRAFRDLKYRDAWLVEILSGYGRSLSLAGRTEEARPILEEALTLARGLQNARPSSRRSSCFRANVFITPAIATALCGWPAKRRRQYPVCRTDPSGFERARLCSLPH